MIDVEDWAEIRRLPRAVGGMLKVLGQFGAVRRKAVWDQEGCIGRWRQGRPVLTSEFQAFRRTVARSTTPFGLEVVPARPWRTSTSPSSPG